MYNCFWCKLIKTGKYRLTQLYNRLFCMMCTVCIEHSHFSVINRNILLCHSINGNATRLEVEQRLKGNWLMVFSWFNISEFLSCLKEVWHEIFTKQFPPGPWVSYCGHFEFFLWKFAGIFTTLCILLVPTTLAISCSLVSMTLVIIYCQCHGFWWLNIVPVFHQFHDDKITLSLVIIYHQ